MSEDPGDRRKHPDLVGFVTQWMREDFCFATLTMARAAAAVNDGEMLRFVWDTIRAHTPTCGGCWKSVLISSEKAAQPLKKRIYRKTLWGAVLAWWRQGDGVFEFEDRAEGQYLRCHVPSWLELPYELPYTGIEAFTPNDRTKTAWVIFDVRDAETFEKPEKLRQHLDVTATREVKVFDISETPLLHWRSIIGDRPYELRVRWEGNVKVLATESSLHGRYQHRLRKAIPEEEREFAPDTTADEATLLHDIAMKYAEDKAWFAGFLDVTLRQRGIDTHRHEQVDAQAHAFSLDGEKQRHRETDDHGWSDRMESSLHEDWKDKQSEKDAKIDEERLLQRLMTSLSERQRRILELKREGRSDQEIATALGIARETANRELGRIRKLAQGLTE